MEPSQNLFITFRKAEDVSEEEAREFFSQFGPAESISIPKRKEGESRICFLTYESEAKAIEVKDAIINNGMTVKGERPIVRFNNNQKENPRRKTVGYGFGSEAGGGFGQGRDENRFGSQSSLNRSNMAGDYNNRPTSRNSGSSQFYANKDIDLSRLVIKVETGNGVRHIECQPECFNLMKQFMSPDELDSGIRAYAIRSSSSASASASQQQQQQRPMPSSMQVEQIAPIQANGQRAHHNGHHASSSSSPVQQPQKQQMPAPPPVPQSAPAAPAPVPASSAASLVAAPVAAAATPVQRFEPRRLAPGARIQAKLIEFGSVRQFTAVETGVANQHYGRIEGLLNRLYNAAGQQPAGQLVANAKPGDCVCAVWSSDGKFYRTVVREAKGSRLTVFFFDEGSIDGVDSEKVRTLAPELIGLPNLALICSLDGVPDSEFVRLRAQLAEANFAVELEIVQCKGFECTVRLYLNGQCLNTAAATVPATVTAVASLPRRCIEFNKATSVLVSEAQSPGELGLMLADCQSDYESVAVVLAGINANNGNELQPLAAIPPIGSDCLARWALDNHFYRARVIQSANDWCRLFFLDDGNTDVAKLDQLKQLPDTLRATPPVAVRCHAANASALRLAQPIEAGSKMLAVFSEARPDSGFDAVLASLRYENQSDAFVASADANATPAAAAPAANLPSVDASDDGSVVRIVLMNSPLDFVVQRIDRDAEFDAFGNELDAFCKRDGAAACQPSELQANSLVAAPYLGVYFRAKICQLSADNSSAEVYFVDYGNTETVGLAQLRKLDPAFVAKPIWGKKCRLHRVAPISNNGQWPDTIQAEVQDKLGKDIAVLRVASNAGAAESIACDLATEQCPSLCEALAAAGLASIVID